MKKFSKYFTITILLLIGLCAVGVLYIFFIPNSNLFGICYISYNQEYFSKSLESNNVSKIVLNSTDYDVKVVPSINDKISVKVYANSLGFLLVKNKEVSISHTVEASTLTFNIKEPTGAVVRNRSYIELRLPADMTISVGINNNNASSSITNEDLTIQNLYYKSNHGSLDISNSTINGLIDLDLNNSTFTLNNTTKTNNNRVNIDVAGGKFDASNAVLGDIIINKNDKGVILAKSCTRLTEKTSRAGGRINIKKVETIDLETSDTNVYIDEIVNSGNIIMTASGNINIGTCQSQMNIKASNGHINIKEAKQGIILTTSNGNINVENAYSFIQAKSTYGDIKVNYNEDADHTTGDGATKRTFTAETENGKITATGVEKVNITITKNGRANIQMDNVIGVNSISAGNGSVYVEFTYGASFDLTTSSKSGSVDVNYQGLEIPHLDKNTKTFNVNDSKGVNSLKVESNAGSLKIRDNTTADQDF